MKTSHNFQFPSRRHFTINFILNFLGIHIFIIQQAA